MSELGDARLERELAKLLRSMDPGLAPAGLRERVARVPGAAPGGSPLTRRLSRAVVPVLGLAATVALLLLTIPLLGPARVGPGPGASAAPAATFDAMLRGPGLVPPPPVEGGSIVIAGLLLGIVLTVAAMRAGVRRGFAVLTVVLVLGYAGVQVLETQAEAGPVASSGGIGVRQGVPGPAGSGRSPLYITASPGEPFSFGFSVANDGPLPIRLEGVVLDPDRAQPATIPSLRAVWRDSAPNSGVTGPAAPSEPFSPMDLAPNEFVTLWIVGTTGECAAGPSFPVDGTTFVGLPAVRVRFSVFGLPRTDTIDLPFDVTQPWQPGGCPPQP